MIRLIEALNYRCLRYVRQELGPFHVLVGPNASGKTTFLDVVAFLGDLVSDGPKEAIGNRTPNFDDLLWGRTGNRLELAVEVAIPDDRKRMLPDDDEYDTIRYEVAIGSINSSGTVGIVEERAFLKLYHPLTQRQLTLFPADITSPETFFEKKREKGTRRVFTKASDGNDNYYTETEERSGKGWFPSMKFGPDRSTLAMLPEDESRWPVSVWLKQVLMEGVQKFILNSLLIRQASPPGQVRGFKPDGSNLPWVIERLKREAPERFHDWIAHLKSSLLDLEDIDTVERPDDKHRYLMLSYAGGLRIPSWMVSDGTLRLLALTLPAYLPDLEGVYLIEEPENGIHPRAVETMFQSLSSVYGAQVLLATHSPVVLGIASRDQVLCFKKTDCGATDIVSGTEHPQLREWQEGSDLGSLFAAGVLG
ncbi:MAG: ATP-binding protein [Pirellulales bacterium]|nr:ATP-binding protein [Pirellulales bacterium]